MLNQQSKLTPAEQVRMLKIAQALFLRRLRELRWGQYQIAARRRAEEDQLKAEELLRSLK